MSGVPEEDQSDAGGHERTAREDFKAQVHARRADIERQLEVGRAQFDEAQQKIQARTGRNLIVATLISTGLLRSRIGRAMVATRDNETAAAVMGVHLATIKTVVFGISAAIAGIAGSLYALKLTLVEPDVPLGQVLAAPDAE